MRFGAVREGEHLLPRQHEADRPLHQLGGHDRQIDLVLRTQARAEAAAHVRVHDADIFFCEPEYAASDEYARFWEKLGRGEFDAGEYKRIGRAGKEVWIQATYNPILDLEGKPIKIVKFALDVTGDKLRNADFESKVSAVSRSQAMIEFDLTGHIVTANENFLRLIDIADANVLNDVQVLDYTMKIFGEFWEGVGFWSNQLVVVAVPDGLHKGLGKGIDAAADKALTEKYFGSEGPTLG